MNRFWMTWGVACGAAMLAASSFAAPVLDVATKNFVVDAERGNIAEIQLGQLAEEKGASQDVRDYGKTLVADHTAAEAKTAGIVESIGMPPPTVPSPQQQATYQRLSSLSGPDFDRTFIRMMVADHEKDIADYRKQELDRTDVGSYVNDTLPTLAKHLDMAKSIQMKIGK